MDRHMFGLNPDYKEFMDQHPGKTILGVAWAMYWRFVVLVIAIEVILFALFVLLAMSARG